jgi:hypothetical protein
LVVEDVSVDELENNREIFSGTIKKIQDGVEMSNTISDGFGLDLGLAYVPVSHAMKRRPMAGNSSLFIMFTKSNNFYITLYPSLQAACKDGYIYGVTDSSLQKDIDKLTTESHSVNIHL